MPCYVSALRRSEREHVLRVLRALGDDVETIEGRCCGQPGYNSGHRDEARSVGREALRAVGPFEAVVVPSGSCTSMFNHYLPGLWEGERGAHARERSQRFVEFCAYVDAHSAVDSLALELSGAVAYHDSCHGRRELHATEAILRVLGRVKGLEVRRLEHEEECCGFGGTFSVKLPEVSRRMAESKVADTTATGAGVLVSADLSCLAHIQSLAGKGFETWTVAEVLSKALS